MIKGDKMEFAQFAYRRLLFGMGFVILVFVYAILYFYLNLQQELSIIIAITLLVVYTIAVFKLGLHKKKFD